MCRRVGVQSWVKSNPSVCLSSHLLNCAVISSFGRTVSRAASVEYVCMYIRDTSRGRPLIICSYVHTPLGHQVIEGRPMVLYVHTYLYVHMYVCMYVHTYLYVHTYVRVYVCTYVPVCTCVCMYVHTCTYIRTCVCMYLRTYICMYGAYSICQGHGR